MGAAPLILLLGSVTILIRSDASLVTPVQSVRVYTPMIEILRCSPRAVLVSALVLVGCTSVATKSAVTSEVQIDGKMEAQEWRDATRYALSAGGDLLLLERDDAIYVGILGPQRGIAHVCVGGDRNVSILHSSAALGTAEYERVVDNWQRTVDFKYEVRDSPQSGAPSAEVNKLYSKQWGWLSNPSHEGSSSREFVIARTPRRMFLGVVFMTIGDDSKISYWPETLRDDCAALRLAQGWANDRQTFNPAGWHLLKPASK